MLRSGSWVCNLTPDPPVLQSFLTEQASTAVKGLLPGWAGGDLAETCSWADQQRFRYRWSSPLHFADTPGDCKFDYASKPLPDSDQTTLFPAILQFQNSECPIRSGRFASGKTLARIQLERGRLLWELDGTSLSGLMRTFTRYKSNRRVPSGWAAMEFRVQTKNA